MGGAEADPITEMLVLEAIAYHDFTSGWCTMVGATAVGSLGAFLPQAGLDRVFANRHIPVTLVHEGEFLRRPPQSFGAQLDVRRVLKS